MQTNEPRLKVKSGQQVFGPMGLTELAELLAAERFSGSDLVAEENGPWVTIEEYVARQSEPQPPTPRPPKPAAPTTSPDDEFLCVPPPPIDDSPLFTPPQPGGPDSDSPLETDSADESDYAPLSESLDPPPARSGESSSVDTDGFYRLPHPAPPEAPPPEPTLPPSPPRQSRSPAADDRQSAEPAPPIPEETALDDILEALSQDEADAPQALPPRAKRPAQKSPRPGDPKRPKRKRKRR